MTHPFLIVWLLLMIWYEFVYVYFIATKNVGDYSYMSSPNIYYRAKKIAPTISIIGTINFPILYINFYFDTRQFKYNPAKTPKILGIQAAINGGIAPPLPNAPDNVMTP